MALANVLLVEKGSGNRESVGRVLEELIARHWQTNARVNGNVMHSLVCSE